MNRMRTAVILLLLTPCAWAWGPSTHAYIASCVTGSRNPDVLFGAMLPDCNPIIRDNAAEAACLKKLAHHEFNRLAPSALKTGFMTHNSDWGADYYAHLIYSKDPETIYSVRKIRQLSDECTITISQAEDVIEMCVDIQIRLALGPSWGALLEKAASASGVKNEQAMVDAFATELAACVEGLGPEEAEADIRMAVKGYKSLASALGGQLQREEADIHAAIPPILAMYLDSDEASVAKYYRRGLEITEDCMGEMDRICVEIKTHMPDTFEVEQAQDTGAEDADTEESPAAVVDFCRAFRQVHENPLLQGLDPEFAAFVELLNPETADLNGVFNVDTSGDTLSIKVTGNGIKDAANELGLLARLLNCPEPVSDNTTGAVPDHAKILAVWKANRAQLDRDIGPAATLVETVVPGLKEILAGFLTLGDGTFQVTSAPAPENPDAPIIASGKGSFGLVAAMFATLNTMLAREVGSGFANPNLNREDYSMLPALLPDGDADGDGFSNAEEYACFAKDDCGAAGHIQDESNTSSIVYTKAALDNSIHPACK